MHLQFTLSPTEFGCSQFFNLLFICALIRILLFSRLRNSREWIYGDITTVNLPNHYVEGYQVEAIDCSKFHHNGIRYEGLQNLSGLNFLKWLSLRNNKYVDVWCIDRIAGQNGDTLEFLDIVGCNICVGCITALARMPALRMLVVSDPGEDLELQAALSILEQEKPKLLIRIEQTNTSENSNSNENLNSNEKKVSSSTM